MSSIHPTPKVQVSGSEIEWQVEQGTLTVQQSPAILLGLDAPIAGLLSAFQAIVGMEQFALVLQRQGRQSATLDWQAISLAPTVEARCAALANQVQVAGWGELHLRSLNQEQQECHFRLFQGWEGRYQKSLGVCWGSSFMAGKLAEFCSQLFEVDCGSEQTSFIARGDAFDEFVVKPIAGTVEARNEGGGNEQELSSEHATLVDLAGAFHRLQQETAERQQAEAEREQLLEQLRVERALFEAVLQQMPAGVVVAEQQTGRTLLANQQVEQVLGYPAVFTEGIEHYARYTAVHADGSLFQPEDYPIVRSLTTGEVVREQEIEFIHGNGDRGILQVSSVPVYRGDEIVAAVAVFHDVTEWKQTERALRRYQLLSEYSRDIVLYLSYDGRILEANQAAVMTYGYERAELLSLWISDLRDPATHSTLAEQFQQAIQKGILFETVHRCRDGHLFPVEVSAQSAVVGNEKVVLSVIRDITERKQSECEREQLLKREHAARTTAEAAERRSAFLAEASTVLVSSLDYEYTLQSVARLAVPTLADWCVVDVVTVDHQLERVATAHIDPAKVEWAAELYRRYPPDLDAAQGIAKVLRTGQPEFYPSISDEQLVAVAQDAEHLQILREVGFSSVMIVPLQTRDRILGTITFASAESGFTYRREDLYLAEELARRAAIALDNARLYEDAQQAKHSAELAADRTARLQSVTAALSESLTPLQVAEVIVEQSMAALDASAALMVLLTEDRTELEIIRAVGYQPDLVEAWRRFSIHTSAPLAEAVRTGKPLWAEPPEIRLAQYPHLRETYLRYDYEGWMSLPLITEGRTVGGMLLSFKTYRDLAQEDRDFIMTLTQQCAQAIARAQLYEAERRARDEAERANRVKDEFLAVLSHELRSPLNPILGWASLLRQRSLSQEVASQAFEAIERNARLQAQLVEDLLDVSRILQGKLNLNVAPVVLGNVIEAAIETVHLAAIAKSISIETVVEPDIPTVMGDANRLQQVVWNLLSNAVKFTPSGGRVVIQLSLVSAAAPPVQEQPNDQPAAMRYAQIAVSDNGTGITPEFLPHVFEYFRQADSTTTRQFGGLGLGLAIVRQVVELHGGTVQAISQGENRGATFTVKLPLSMAPPPGHQRAEPFAQPVRDLSGVCVLVVDDDADMRTLAEFVLVQAGAQVITAASAAETFACLVQASPDVLLCDIGMPDVDGYALIRQLRARSPEQGSQIPAIALTAYAGEANQQLALQAGFQRHLSKPIEPQALIKAMIDLLELP